MHPAERCCPRWGRLTHRPFRPNQAFPGYRCRDCAGAFTIVTGTPCEKTRQRPATIVVLLRGDTQGATTARLSHELSRSSKQTLTLRHRIQDHANETASLERMDGRHFEAAEAYQHAGKKSDRHGIPSDPPRRRANQQPGRGAFCTDRPPSFQVVSRDSGAPVGL